MGATFAQNPNLQQARALAEAQRKIDSIMKDPKLRQLMNKTNQGGSSSALAANPMALLSTANKPDTAFLPGVKIPPKNEKGLASIPAQPLSKTQLVAFIKNIKTKIFAAMPGIIGRQPLNMSGYDAETLDKGSVLAWCSGNSDLALELALDAANLNPNDDNILDNLSGILTMCGLPYEAVPILDFIRQNDPGNGTINNNLGQAYFLMGDAQKAAVYLQAAIGDYADHPQANFALACLAYSNGDKSKAASYCEHSLRGAFMVNSWTMLKVCKPNARLMDLVRHRYKQQDYFSPHKYPLLPQCREVKEVRSMVLQYREYNNMLIHMKERYEHLVKADADWVKNNMATEVMARVQQHKNPFRPYSILAQAVIGDIGEDLADRLKRLNAYDSNYFRQMADLQKDHDTQIAQVVQRFEGREEAAGEGNPDMELESDECKAANAVHNKFLPLMADLTEEWQRQWVQQTKDFYNDYAYWCYLASPDDHSYRQMFYSVAVQGWIALIMKLNTTKFLSCHLPVTYSKKEADSLEVGEGKCPFNAKITAGLKEPDKDKPEKFASFDINCEEFKVDFDLPEGANLSVKQRASGSTTVAFDAGLDASKTVRTGL